VDYASLTMSNVIDEWADEPHKSCLTSPKKDQLLVFLLDKILFI